MEDLKYIIYHSEDGVGVIQFNRPEKLNAINSGLLRDLERALSICEEDDDIRVIVLTGNEKTFIAGADIGLMATGDIRDALELTDLGMRVQERLADLPKPTIASVAGFALGGGCEMALCCDFRIAAENAVFGQPEIKLGLIPGGGGTQRLPRLVGLGPATKMLFLGEQISAQKAMEIGLVDEVVPLNDLERAVSALSARLIQQPRIALRAIKTAMRKGLNASLKEGLIIEQDLFAMLFGTEDSKEGLSAFLLKRQPRFKGR